MEHNLTGTSRTVNVPNCHLKHSNEAVTAIVDPDTVICVGDHVFMKYDRENKPILKEVIEIMERRPSKGDWVGVNEVHKDFISLKLAA